MDDFLYESTMTHVERLHDPWKYNLEARLKLSHDVSFAPSSSFRRYLSSETLLTSDEHGIARVRLLALQTPIAAWLGHNGLERIDFYAARVRRNLITSEDTSYVAVADGKVVGYINYKIVGESVKTWLQWFESLLLDLEDSLWDLQYYIKADPDAIFKARRAAFDKFLTSARQERMGHRERYVYISLLVIDPDAQGTGVGGKLLQMALDDALKRGIPTFLESSVRGHQFYLKRGFKDMQNDIVVKDGDKVLERLPALIFNDDN